MDQLQLDISKVNVNGGAMYVLILPDLGGMLMPPSAFGHPLGATGVRQVVTGLAELRRRDESILCTSMCIGSG